MDTSSLPAYEEYLAVERSPDFIELRRRWSRFVLWATVGFLGWWFIAIVLGAAAPALIRTRIVDEFNLGALFVLVSFAVVPLLCGLYLRYARTRLDPLAEQVRAHMEGESR